MGASIRSQKLKYPRVAEAKLGREKPIDFREPNRWPVWRNCKISVPGVLAGRGAFICENGPSYPELGILGFRK